MALALHAVAWIPALRILAPAAGVPWLQSLALLLTALSLTGISLTLRRRLGLLARATAGGVQGVLTFVHVAFWAGVADRSLARIWLGD